MNDWVGGLPRAAHERVERQRASRTAGSLLSAPAAASVQSAGLVPVGEVFGCLVMNMGWAGTGCGWRGLPTGGLGAFLGAASVSPIITSGRGGAYSGFAPYTKAYETGWNGALQRMLAEARALGAHGVVGVQIRRSHLAGATWEFTALGTAVRSIDPLKVPFPTVAGEVWHTNLNAEDTASSILSGFQPKEIVLGISISTKHEDWQLRQQRTSWVNGEVSGMSQLIQSARHESRVRLAAHATHTGGAELVVTDMTLHEFETPCGGQEGKDFHAEAVTVGTTLVPIPRFRRNTAPPSVLTILPLSDERKL
ncbi:heavy metal-binding domain-containing protein [Subtercola boreus]|uniref:Heavy metal-binding domain-containing protein n=1 Tax=Subtercola boreus TaxID=120213 RepID=A0A3E0W7W2_9MICO|nr:heavy metal-binding domain-containing protein [Subtercola boreus]RFA17994.1 hypothetical protein B7R24_15160 [Subtercola boreus]RFA18376.1 hypothetical protein B7R23_15195 [Subtercola boreus]RFA24905.1 hypothetical protein B7R25_15190 [Subtercola boreus]